MPDLEISKLPSLAGDNLQASDPVPLSDLSASETKKITVKDLVQAGIGLIDDGSIPSDKVEGGGSGGGVSQITAGDNITISPVTGIGNVTVNATATPYTLPIASEVLLGGIKVGNNLSISDSGVLSAVSSGGSSYKGPADFTGAEPDAVNGDFYINTTAGTGAWSGFVGDPVVVNQRAIYNGTDWDLLPSDSNESYWLPVVSDYGTGQALRPVEENDGLEVRGPYNYNPGLTASDFAVFEADNSNDRAKLEWRKDNASLSFEKEKDAPDGSSNPCISVDIDGALKVKDGEIEVCPSRSSDWDDAGSVMICATNYSENTFAVNYMGDVDIRRSLSVGNIGGSGARLPGVIKGISRDDEDATSVGFSLEYGSTTPFSVDYAGDLYIAGQIEAIGGIKFGDGTVQTTAGGGGGGAVTKIVAGDNVTVDPVSGVGEVTINADVGEGLWEQDGSSLTPKEDGASLKIEGSVAGIESTIANGTMTTKINDGNTQQLFAGQKGANTVFFVSHDGDVNATGTITAAVFDLESLEPLPA